MAESKEIKMPEDKFTLLHSRTISNMVVIGHAKYINKELAEELADTHRVFFSSLKMLSGEEVTTYAVENKGITNIIEQVNIVKECYWPDLPYETNKELDKLFNMIDIESKIDVINHKE